jgi:hypothetical protein
MYIQFNAAYVVVWGEKSILYAPVLGAASTVEPWHGYVKCRMPETAGSSPLLKGFSLLSRNLVSTVTILRPGGPENRWRSLRLQGFRNSGLYPCALLWISLEARSARQSRQNSMSFGSSAISATIRINALLHYFLGAPKLMIPSCCMKAAFGDSVECLLGETLTFGAPQVWSLP